MAIFDEAMKSDIGAVGDIVGIGSAIAGMFGGGKNKSALRAQENMFQQQLQQQREFAQHGISWRVEDAKRAGIHPLYALGAQTTSYSPATYISGDEGSSGVDHFARSGQDLSRALKAASSASTRADSQFTALSLRRAELENELLAAQIAKERSQIGPPLPMPGESRLIPGQGDSPLGLTVAPAPAHVQQKPMEVTVPNPRNTSQEPHAVSDLGFTWTGTGYAPVPSKDAKDRLEDMGIPQMSWAWRNSILPNFGAGNPPPAHLIPEGYNNWRWSYSKQEWQPHFNPRRARVPVRRGMHGPDNP